MISVHPETELNRGGDREQDGIKEYNENGTRMRLVSLTTSQFQESVINWMNNCCGGNDEELARNCKYAYKQIHLRQVHNHHHHMFYLCSAAL